MPAAKPKLSIEVTEEQAEVIFAALRHWAKEYEGWPHKGQTRVNVEWGVLNALSKGGGTHSVVRLSNKIARLLRGRRYKGHGMSFTDRFEFRDNDPYWRF